MPTWWGVREVAICNWTGIVMRGRLFRGTLLDLLISRPYMRMLKDMGSGIELSL